MQLEAQLADAIADREERLRDLEIAAQKEALQAEIDLINQKADEEASLLDEQQAAIEEAYAERLTDASLQAEAEKLIMEGSQEELLALLSTYATDYDAVGQTLGESLLEGFQSKVGDITTWFESFNDQLATLQEQWTSTALAGIDSFATDYASRVESQTVTVEQTVNFNQVAESPSEISKRMAEANQALADELLTQL